MVISIIVGHYDIESRDLSNNVIANNLNLPVFVAQTAVGKTVIAEKNGVRL